MPHQSLTYAEVEAALRSQGLRITAHVTSDAARAACDHCWHTLVQTEMCYWCGQPRARQHGPYLPEGER